MEVGCGFGVGGEIEVDPTHLHFELRDNAFESARNLACYTSTYAGSTWVYKWVLPG